MTKAKIKIDVVSDVVCPWCYIGKRRLEKAIETMKEDVEFEITYHPFELNPQTPTKGVNQKEYLSEKFGGEEQYDKITNQTTQVAASEGLAFHFDAQQVSPNTRKAHALLQAAQAEGVQVPLMEIFFKAYFTDGIDLTHDNNLIDLATRAGMSKEKATQTLTDESSLMQVSLAEQELYKLGISSVPFYILNNRYGISGAQAPETFVQAFKEAIQKEPANLK